MFLLQMSVLTRTVFKFFGNETIFLSIHHIARDQGTCKCVIAPVTTVALKPRPRTKLFYHLKVIQ